MNALRFRVMGGEDCAVLVRSTLDKSWKLAPKTDEQIQFTRDDLINIKNASEHKILVKLKSTLREDGDIIVRSSRRGAFVLPTDDIKIWFQPGEVLNVRSMSARDPKNGGPMGVPA